MNHTSGRPAALLWALFIVTVLLAWGIIIPQPPVRADSPPNLTSDINWNAGTSGVADVEAAYNYARRQEESQLGLTNGSLGNLNLPSQAIWSTYSDDDKALYIINAERVARAGMKPGVIGLPIIAVQPNLDAVSQGYASYLLANNMTGHTADGRTPTQRIDADPELKRCREFLGRPENLAYFWTSGTSIPLYIERAIYLWIYDDAVSAWGHREAALLQDKDLTFQNPANGYNNNLGSTADEGFIGVGVTKGPHQGWNHGTIVVMNFIDPKSTGTCPWEVAKPAPTVSSIAPNSGQNTGTVQITNLAGSNFQAGAAVKLTKSGHPDIPGTSVSVVSASKITCQFNLSGAATGAWNVVVTNPDAQSATLSNSFTVSAPSGFPSITSITPNSGQNTGTVQITNLAGSNFQSGASVSLTRSGYAPVNATNVSVVSASKITCRFNLGGVAPGRWGVTVTNPGLRGGTLPNAFTVTAPAPPPGDKRIYMPLAVRRWPPATEDVFSAVADTYIRQGFPNFYYGTADVMMVGYDPAGCWGGRISRSLINFDLDRIPPGATVQKATLHLELISSCDHGPSSGPITAYRVRDYWNPDAVTWNSRPDHAEAVGQVTISTRDHRRYSMDVTGWLQGWANRSFNNYGIMLRGPESSDDRSAVVGFATRNYLTGAQAARIEVTYTATTASAAPAPASGTGIGPEAAEPGRAPQGGTLPGPQPGVHTVPDAR